MDNTLKHDEAFYDYNKINVFYDYNKSKKLRTAASNWLNIIGQKNLP